MLLLTVLEKFKIINSNVTKKRFKRVYIEITNICNLSCEFCPDTKRAKKTMTADEFLFVAKQVSLFTDYVYLHILGEPLIHSDLKKILSICQDYNLKVNITTNGRFLKAVLNTLQNAKTLRKVAISLHSAQDGITDVDKHLNDCIFAADTLSSDVIIEYRLWNLKKFINSQNTNDLPEFNKFVLDYLKNHYNKHSFDAKGDNINSFLLAPNIYAVSAENFDWPDINGKYYGDKGKCYGLKTQLGILCDGTVVPCCLDSEGNIALGNIFKSTLEEIINSERANNIYENFKKGYRVEELCKRCGYSERF